MSSTQTNLFVTLDCYEEMRLGEALRGYLPAIQNRVDVSLSGFGAPKYRGLRPLPWPELIAAAERMVDAALQVAKSSETPPALYLGGQAPIPLFVHVAHRLASYVGTTYLANLRENTWELIPLHADAASRRPFFNFSIVLPPIASERGRLAIFVSILGRPAPRERIDDLFRHHKQEIAALVEISTPHHAALNNESGPRAFTQLRELLALATMQFPNATGAALFVAGPAVLASMLGLAIPDALVDLWLTNYERDSYNVAVPNMRGAPAVPEEVAPALHLKSLRVRGFKSIRDSDELALPTPTVFVGRNSTGKSSLLEALQWLQAAASSGVQAATKPYHVFSDLLNKSSRALEIDLKLSGAPGEPDLIYHLSVTTGPRGAPFVSDEVCTFGANREIYTHERARVIADGPSLRDSDKLALASATGSQALGANRLHAFLRNAVFLRLNPRHLARPSSLQFDAQGPLLDEEGATLPALLRIPAIVIAWIGHRDHPVGGRSGATRLRARRGRSEATLMGCSGLGGDLLAA